MEAGEAVVEKLTVFKKVVKVGAGERVAGGAVASRVNRGGVETEAGIRNIYSLAGIDVGGDIEAAVSGQAGGSDAIEHVGAGGDSANEIGGTQADTHGVAGFVGGKKIGYPF